MMNDLAFIESLLKPPPRKNSPVKQTAPKFPPPPQAGVVRHYDRERLCDHDGTFACRAPTYIEVQGVPMCMVHALRKLNEMLIGLGVKE